MPKFSERLKALRKERGLKQREMAETVSYTHLRAHENEYDETYPTVPGLVFLADYFDVSTDYLLGRTDCREVKRTNP